MKRIVIATNNKGKLEMIKSILGSDIEVLSLKDINCNINVIENGDTFKENAIKKAREISTKINMPCISDDSGLCIKQLNGWPGIYTARFLGKNATDKQRNKAILEKMINIKDRTSYFKCSMAYCYNKQVIVESSSIEGKIALKERGNNGFGFDEIFELEDGRTLAELTLEEKSKISIRRYLIEKLKKYI